MNAALEMFAYAQALGEDRRGQPARRPHVGADARRGRRRPAHAQEFGSFFILLVVAGNETTRNAISHGMRALTEHPDQRELWYGDFEAHTKTAVEEIVRWAIAGDPLPPHGDRATPSCRGQQIEAGQKVVLFYNSANRDERMFAGPVPRSTSPARSRRPRSASAPAARTSASAPTSPAARSP